jgi:hypothetical protein
MYRTEWAAGLNSVAQRVTEFVFQILRFLCRKMDGKQWKTNNLATVKVTGDKGSMDSRGATQFRSHDA